MYQYTYYEHLNSNVLLTMSCHQVSGGGQVVSVVVFYFDDPEVCGSNLVIGKFYVWMDWIQADK